MITDRSRRRILYGMRSVEQVRSRLAATSGRPETPIQLLTPATTAAEADPQPERDGDDAWRRQTGEAADSNGQVWFWQGSESLLLASAGGILRDFLLPLCRTGRSFTLAVPVDRQRIMPRALDVASIDSLDLEDIATLFDLTRDEAPISHPDNGHPPPDERHRPPLDPATGPPPHLAGLDSAQTAAASHLAGPARVLAPAGAGKTKTMIAHVAHLISAGVRPSQILVLAFNTEAARQLEERLGALGVPCARRIPPLPDRAVARLGPGPVSAASSGVHCATFNAFGFRYQRDIAGAAVAVTADDALRERLLRSTLADSVSINCDERGGHQSEVDGGDPAAAGGARNGRAPDPFDTGLGDRAWRLGRLLTAVRSDLAPPSAADRPLLAGHDRRQAQAGLQSFDDQVYAALAHLLADPAARAHVQRTYRHVLVDEFQDVNAAQLALLDVLTRPWRDLYVVGDDDQLIYGWRNARPASILQFGKQRPRLPSPTTYVLGTNYRGSQSVVERADRLIRHNRVRLEKSVLPRPDAPEGGCHLFGAPDWPVRARALAAYLGAERARLQCGWNDLAVLCRYRMQLEAAAVQLRRLGIPVSAPPPTDLFGSAAARRLEERLARLLAPTGTLPPPERALARWLREERPRAVEALEEIVAVLGLENASAPARGAAGGVHEVLDAARLLAWDHADLPSFLAVWTSLAGRPDARASTADGVTMATIHATKGREYHAVAIVDFAPPVLKATPEEVEEERRVLYVGVTRARHSALLTLDLSRPVHPFMIELCESPPGSRLRLKRRERAHAACLARAGLAGLPWESPRPAWVGNVRALTAAQGEQLATAFRLRSAVLEARLLRRSRRRMLPF